MPQCETTQAASFRLSEVEFVCDADQFAGGAVKLSGGDSQAGGKGGLTPGLDLKKRLYFCLVFRGGDSIELQQRLKIQQKLKI